MVEPWRVRDRMKTVSVALVLCLNIGVDPPDVTKPKPCARLEAWLDPNILPADHALDQTVKALQFQYERWQPRARYKTSTDPTMEEIKKLCQTLRRSAKEERVLFHYNGHGVPKPTVNGEIWVFNKGYTQYIPLSVVDLQSWMGSPSIYVFDCSAAGLILKNFLRFSSQRSSGGVGAEGTGASEEILQSSPSSTDCILLAACDEREILPTNPDLPADLFTSCLTTPIKMALRWFAPRALVQKVSNSMLDRIPGKLNDRKTPLGELNWIFTAVTDTIAWNVLPRPLFKRLFRQDLLVASLFRNFLLAERIMWSANCSPVSYPPLPPTHDHHLWQAWDHTMEHCLAQLPGLLATEEEGVERSFRRSPTTSDEAGKSGELPPQDLSYVANPFFEDQMIAFETWLQMGPMERNAPEQLPIVLQVLLSQVHRLRALKLLARFLGAGPWAIDLALSVGIFPYVLKLLASPAEELRQELVFIWGKILSLDRSCEVDLAKENGQAYFVEFLRRGIAPPHYLGMAAFVMGTSPLDRRHEAGQAASICIGHWNHEEPIVRRWVMLCLAQYSAVSFPLYMHLLQEFETRISQMCLEDPASDVRAASIYLLRSGIISLMLRQSDNTESSREVNSCRNLVIRIFRSVLQHDSSVLVRQEVSLALVEVASSVAVDYHSELRAEIHGFFELIEMVSHDVSLPVASPCRRIVEGATDRDRVPEPCAMSAALTTTPDVYARSVSEILHLRWDCLDYSSSQGDCQRETRQYSHPFNSSVWENRVAVKFQGIESDSFRDLDLLPKSVAFLPDKTSILVGCAEGLVYSIGLTSGELVELESFRFPNVSDVVFLEARQGIFGEALLQGTCDGTLKLWQRDDTSDPYEEFSIWHAAGPLVASRQSFSCFSRFSWCEKEDVVYSCGNVPGELRKWDLVAERCAWLSKDIGTTDLICIAGLDSHVSLCGDTTGMVFLIDSRCQFPCVGSQQVGTSPVVALRALRGSHAQWDAQFIGCTEDGEVSVWDVRGTHFERKRTVTLEPVMAFACSADGEYWSIGGKSGNIAIYKDGELSTLLQYHNGFLRTRLGPSAALCWDLQGQFLAAAFHDGIVSVFE